MSKKYEWKARGGSKGVVEADNLLDLIKQVNIGLMNELGYYLDEFTSIEEIKPKTIMVCKECKTQSWTMEDVNGQPITDWADRDAFCFKCRDFAHIIDIEEKDND